MMLANSKVLFASESNIDACYCIYTRWEADMLHIIADKVHNMGLNPQIMLTFDEVCVFM